MRVCLRALSFIIVLSMLLTAFSLVATSVVSADQSGDYTYSASDGVATITGYTGAGGAITIPPALGGFPVGVIGDSAFFNNNDLDSVIIPDSITIIGNYSFSGDGNLVSVTLGSSVTSIGAGAFYDCAIGKVTIPASVTSIGLSAFGRCDNLWEINVDPGNLNYASANGVLYNKTLTTLIEFPFRGGGFLIPNGVITIGKYAFANCPVSSVTIPSSVTTIVDGAFGGCGFLASVNIGSGVTSIGIASFGSCYNLDSITFYGLVAPTYVGDNWITGTASSLTGHANAASDFPAPGNTWNGLTMGAVISASPVAPGAPTSLQALGGPGYVVLSWLAPTDVGSPVYAQYDVFRSTTSGSYGASIGNVDAFTLTYNDTTPTSGTLYYYEVKAVNTAGPGPSSNEAEGEASPTSGPQVPSAPQSLVITNGDNSVVLDWSAPANAGDPALTSYDIYRGATAGSIGSIPIGSVAAGTLTYNDITAVNGDTYVYVVKAVNSVGSSAASNTAQGDPTSTPSSSTSNNDMLYVGIVIVVVLVMIIGAFWYMRGKKRTPPKSS